MTAPNGPILFNSSTGSDSNASGLGPASAVVGSSAELDGTATVDVSYDGMDLSGISAGDLLFCETSSGRKFSIIASVDTLGRWEENGNSFLIHPTLNLQLTWLPDLRFHLRLVTQKLIRQQLLYLIAGTFHQHEQGS